jgi:hypothetical protein
LASLVAHPTIAFLDPYQHQDPNSRIRLKRHQTFNSFGESGIVKPDDPLGGAVEVGDEKADGRVQLALVPLDLAHRPPRLGPVCA